ncbi:hypothetical protein BDV97DRAFT_373926 [Delphinella strobiligena]|nr:hypothetical protein BDV97DRAFT_373926 [Delphinella strobiligena]
MFDQWGHGSNTGTCPCWECRTEWDKIEMARLLPNEPCPPCMKPRGTKERDEWEANAEEARNWLRRPIEEPRVLRLTIRDQGNKDTTFMIKETTVLSKLMNAYTTREYQQPGYFRFYHFGERINEAATPRSLQFGDSEVIEVYTEQLGGGVESAWNAINNNVASRA